MGMELVHGKPGEKGFEVLDLSPSAWEQLVELGKKHGWDPAHGAQDKNCCNFSIWYYWSKPAEVPRVQAIGWAGALEKAVEIPALKNASLPKFFRESKRGADMALADSNYAHFNGLSREMIERFIKFLKRGNFIYAVWD